MARAAKGASTSLNLYVLAREFAFADEIPNRIEQVSVPHFRRLLAAGLIAARGREALYLTPAGVVARDEALAAERRHNPDFPKQRGSGMSLLSGLRGLWGGAGGGLGGTWHVGTRYARGRGIDFTTEQEREFRAHVREMGAREGAQAAKDADGCEFIDSYAMAHMGIGDWSPGVNDDFNDYVSEKLAEAGHSEEVSDDFDVLFDALRNELVGDIEGGFADAFNQVMLDRGCDPNGD